MRIWTLESSLWVLCWTESPSCTHRLTCTTVLEPNLLQRGARWRKRLKGNEKQHTVLIIPIAASNRRISRVSSCVRAEHQRQGNRPCLRGASRLLGNPRRRGKHVGGLLNLPSHAVFFLFNVLTRCIPQQFPNSLTSCQFEKFFLPFVESTLFHSCVPTVHPKCSHQQQTGRDLNSLSCCRHLWSQCAN